MKDILLQMTKLREQFIAPNIDVELECRMLIPEPLIWQNYHTIDLHYYNAIRQPTITLRKINNEYIETKELIQRQNIDNVNIVLSIEKKYKQFNEIIIPTLQRNIQRQIIHDIPYTTITKENNIFMLEIEFDETTLDKCYDIIQQYKIPYWPATKPIDAYASEIIAHLISNEYHMSPKADGEHVIIYDYTLAIFDNGKKYLINDQPYSINDAKTIVEAEYMGNNTFLVFDVLRAHHKDITHYTYTKRKTYHIPTAQFILKPSYPIDSYSSLVKAYNEPFDYPTDGFILTPTYKNNNIYKSKPIPTVDLQYIDGFLYLAGEHISKRQPNTINHHYENGSIYEFDMNMNLLRERKDKIIPNYRMPVEIDPLTSIVTNDGIPCLRYYHNKIKLKMLDLLPSSLTLLDIGSGYGGDITKWNKYKHIYTVDPLLQLRHPIPHNVTTIRCRLQDIPPIQYDAISLFFVPWDDSFLPYLVKAKYILLILMSRPQNINSEYVNVNVENDNVHLKLSSTVTAENINEKIPNIKYIKDYIIQHKFKEAIIKSNFIFGSSIEKKLASMYTYHYFHK
ncbi:unnamed protein product [Cunninghamella echinulata]